MRCAHALDSIALAALLLVSLSCERKRFDNPYDLQNIQDAPDLVSPADGECCATNPPSIMWEAKEGRFEYHIVIDTNPDFPDTGYPFGAHRYDTTIMDSDHFLFHLGYCEDKTYHCKIRSAPMDLYPRAWSRWSQPRSFTVKLPLVDRCTLDFVPTYAYPKLLTRDTVFISDEEGNVHVYGLYPLRKVTEFPTGLDEFYVRGVEDNVLWGYERVYYADTLTVAIFDISNLQQVTTVAEFKLDYYSVGHDYTFSANRFAYLSQGDSVFLFDVSAYPMVDSALFVPSFNCYAVQLINDALYLFVYEQYYAQKIIVFDISNIHAPQETCRLKFYHSVYPEMILDGFFYLNAPEDEYHVLGTADCFHPWFEGSLDERDILSVNRNILVAREMKGAHYYFEFFRLTNGFPTSTVGSILLGSAYASRCQLGNHYFAVPHYGSLYSFRINTD